MKTTNNEEVAVMSETKIKRACYSWHGHASNGVTSREYHSWCNMRARCYDRKNNRYEYYGARGIRVCASWAESFSSFIGDMGLCPDGCSLGRKDNDKDYTPSNCRWETRIQQANNKSTNRALTARGVTQNLAQWIRQTGNSESMIYHRIKRGWSIEKSIFTPTKRPDLTYGTQSHE